MRNLLLLLTSTLSSLPATAADFICRNGNGQEVGISAVRSADQLKRLPFTDCREVLQKRISDQSLPAQREDRVALANAVAAFPDTLHSLQGFPFINYPRRFGDREHRNFPEETTVGQLSDEHGNVLLFRNISQPYCPGYVEGTTHVKDEGHAYSYSLSPAIVGTWVSAEPDAYTLIAIQNMDREALLAPVWEKNGGTEALERRPLRDELLVRNIGNFEEVKVPVAQEKVVAVIKQAEARKILAEFGGRPFTLLEFLGRTLRSPALRLPAKSCH